MRNINEIIIHCTATPEGREYSVEQIRKWHQNRGWNDIGYHYVIHLDGTVENGRPLALPGAHCLNHNAHSIGIVYVGGMAAQGKHFKNTMTPAQEASLVQLIRDLQLAYPAIKRNIHGHNEFSVKRCPCFDVQDWRKRWEI